MSAIPSKASFTGASVTEGQFKAALETLHDYLTGLVGSDGAIATARTALAVGIRGHIAGLTLSNSATDADHDIDIAAGEAVDSTHTYLMALAAKFTKQIDATWASGSNAGGLFSGTVANNTWYHVFLIRKDSDGSIDAGFDTSVSAANIPSGYTAFRLLMSVLTDGSANILPFRALAMAGGPVMVLWDVPLLDFSGSATTGARTLHTLRTPLGRQVPALLDARIQDVTTSGVVLFTSPDQTDSAPTFSSAGAGCNVACETGGAAGARLLVPTNTSSQVGSRGTATSTTIYGTTAGWMDPRT